MKTQRVKDFLRFETVSDIGIDNLSRMFDGTKILLFYLMLTCSIAFAQPGGGPSRPGPGGCGVPGRPPCDPGPPPVPITGIEILLGAGALLGVRKYVQGRKKEEAGA